MADPAFPPSKEKSQQAETELQAVLRELGSERVDAVKALVDPRLLKLFEASHTHVLVHVVPHKCCVPLTGKAKGPPTRGSCKEPAGPPHGYPHQGLYAGSAQPAAAWVPHLGAMKGPSPTP